jgi:hypothetical protein
MPKTSIAAPAIARDSNDRTSAPSSTMGPREVLTSREVGFMSASSAAPTSHCVRAQHEVDCHHIGFTEELLPGD